MASRRTAGNYYLARPPVVFPSFEFAIFFPLVLGVSWLLMPRPTVWKPFILAASYTFYAAASVKYCLLLAGVALANQAGAVLVDRTEDEHHRNWITAAAGAIDLAGLGLFKYYGFFSQQVGDFLDSIGLGMPVPLLTLALPVGLSFWTFQAISYVVDVKRRIIRPGKTIDVALYLSFFPHVVAGPIVRAREFLPQLAKPRDPRDVAVGGGVVLIAIGLVKKVVIADYLARTVVDPVFGVPQAYHAPDAILATYAYGAQIYCDFSGYTDIAIGLALLMGFIFPLNFNSPYRATGFRDFWRRWHMTLSRFLRDYVYIPLGGNRRGRARTYANLMTTMLLGGLWHGASWNFVLWGGFHGAGLSTEHALGGRIGRRTPGWLRWLVTFNLVMFGWILFRTQDLTQFWDFVSRLASPGPATLWSWTVVGAVALVVGLQLVPARPLELLQVRVERLRPVLVAAALVAVILFVGATVP